MDIINKLVIYLASRWMVCRFLPGGLQIVGYARSPLTDEQLRQRLAEYLPRPGAPGHEHVRGILQPHHFVLNPFGFQILPFFSPASKAAGGEPGLFETSTHKHLSLLISLRCVQVESFLERCTYLAGDVSR